MPETTVLIIDSQSISNRVTTLMTSVNQPQVQNYTYDYVEDHGCFRHGSTCGEYLRKRIKEEEKPEEWVMVSDGVEGEPDYVYSVATDTYTTLRTIKFYASLLDIIKEERK